MRSAVPGPGVSEQGVASSNLAVRTRGKPSNGSVVRAVWAGRRGWALGGRKRDCAHVCPIKACCRPSDPDPTASSPVRGQLSTPAAERDGAAGGIARVAVLANDGTTLLVNVPHPRDESGAAAQSIASLTDELGYTTLR